MRGRWWGGANCELEGNWALTDGAEDGNCRELFGPADPLEEPALFIIAHDEEGTITATIDDNGTVVECTIDSISDRSCFGSLVCRHVSGADSLEVTYDVTFEGDTIAGDSFVAATLGGENCSSTIAVTGTR